MPLVKVTNGTTLVDEDIVELMSRYTWTIVGDYVRADYAKRQHVSLHRFVFHRGIPERIVGQIDHKNRDTLDNRRDNLRLVTNRQNALNRAKPSRGYFWRADRQVWQVRFRVNGRLKCYGCYQTEEEAKDAANTVSDHFRKVELA